MQPRERLPRDTKSAIPDGTYIVERPAHFMRDGERVVLSIVLGGDANPRLIEVHQNQMLEVMEQEFERGYVDFVVSGELTAYKSVNKLLLRKVLRRVHNGNLAP
jgi:hypothetical protein